MSAEQELLRQTAERELPNILAASEYQPRILPRSYAERLLEAALPRLKRVWHSITDWLSGFLSPSDSTTVLPDWVIQLLDALGQILMYSILGIAVLTLAYIAYQLSKTFRSRRMTTVPEADAVLEDEAEMDLDQLYGSRHFRELLFALRRALRRELSSSLPIQPSTTDRQIQLMIDTEHVRRSLFDRVSALFEANVFRDAPLNEAVVSESFKEFRAP